MKTLACSCCGAYAPAIKQWHNRDTGYGLCPKCANWLKTKEPETMESYYGVEGVHYFLVEPNA